MNQERVLLRLLRKKLWLQNSLLQRGRVEDALALDDTIDETSNQIGYTSVGSDNDLLRQQCLTLVELINTFLEKEKNLLAREHFEIHVGGKITRFLNKKNN